MPRSSSARTAGGSTPTGLLREAGIRADRLGYDSLWTWDHLYPIQGDHHGPIFEGWLTLAAWAEATEKVTVGLMVGANTFRLPTLVAREVTTLDHISGGRAVLGIGGAWFETEHDGLGIEFGSSPGERLRWLAEAVPIMRGMLDGAKPSGSRYYHAKEALNEPRPIQDRLPILVGGGGEEDAPDRCPVGRRLQSRRQRREREAQGRDPATALRPGRPRRVGDRAHLGAGTPVIRDDPAEAKRVFEAIFAHNGGAEPEQPGDRQAGAGRRALSPVRVDRLPAPRSASRRRTTRRRWSGCHRGEADARRVLSPRLRCRR